MSRVLVISALVRVEDKVYVIVHMEVAILDHAPQGQEERKPKVALIRHRYPAGPVLTESNDLAQEVVRALVGYMPAARKERVDTKGNA